MSLISGPYSVANSDFYARALGHVLRAQRLYDPSYALTRDPDVYDRMRRDAVIAFALRYRKLLAAGRDWYLEPASADPKDRLLLKILEDLLKELEHFDTARFNLSEAIIAGSRWAKIRGELKVMKVANLPESEWYVVRELDDVDKRRMRFQPVDLPQIRETVIQQSSQNEIPSVRMTQRKEWRWQAWRPLQNQWEEIDRGEWVHHVYDDREDTLGYGGGLADELYNYWFAKEVTLQHGLQYLERWSQGIVLAMVDTLRDGKASSPVSSVRTTEWLDALHKMRSRHVLVADAKDRLEVKDAPTGGWQAAMEMLRYLDGAMRVAILGSELPTSSDATGGSFAMAEVQQDTTEALSRFDQVGIEETLRRDVLGWLFRKNYVMLDALGLGCCTLPYVKLREGRRDNAEVRADVLLKARQAKLEIRRDEAYAQLGFSPPAPGDAILSPMENLGGGGPNPFQVGKSDEREESDSETSAPTRSKREASKGGKQGHNLEKPFLAALNTFGARLDRFTEAATMQARQPSINKFQLPSVLEIKQEPPTVHVHVPEAKPPVVHVQVPAAEPNITVKVPQQHMPAPNVKVVANMPQAPAPTVMNPVTVNVPAAQPEITVQVPEQKPPVVNVQVPTPPARKLTLERDARGFITGGTSEPETLDQNPTTKP